ncbi:MAG: exopolysaccharide biosynthesis polyprenyl glycosylphosphotransferase [Arenicella sp.]|jgi:exopolysaccharide biosynthesis polyprenyl glycosylphosphotransferase
MSSSSSREQLVIRTFLVSDILMLILTQICALALSASDFSNNGLYGVLAMRISLLNVIMMFGFIIYWVILLRLVGSASLLTRGSVWWKHIAWIAFAAAINSAVLMIVGRALDISIFTSDYILLSTYLLVGFTFFGRKLVTGIINAMHLGDKNARYLIILGTGSEAHAYAEALESTPNSSLNVVGFIEPSESMAPEQVKVSVDRIVCCLGDFEDYYLNNVIDDVVICLPFSKYDTRVTGFIEMVGELGLALKWSLLDLLPVISNKSGAKARLEFFSETNIEVPQLVVFSGHTFNFNYVAKRFIDSFLSLFVLIATSPLMLLAIIAIKVTSPGKALFIQKRYGYNGRVIDVFKLRTMVANAPELQDKLRESDNEMDGGAFKMKSDPRVTGVGKFLRKVSIDELPQLFNVLKGDMSIVGPRPLPLEDYKRFTQITHRRRLSVLPGITGPWQVSGRNNISFEKWMQLDIDYIENWTVWTDIRLILLTVPAVLFGRGAS